MADKIEGYLEVGINERGEVVINLDKDRTGHIVFTPNQARSLAAMLIKQAADVGMPEVPEFGYLKILFWRHLSPEDRLRVLTDTIGYRVNAKKLPQTVELRVINNIKREGLLGLMWNQMKMLGVTADQSDASRADAR